MKSEKASAILIALITLFSTKGGFRISYEVLGVSGVSLAIDILILVSMPFICYYAFFDVFSRFLRGYIFKDERK